MKICGIYKITSPSGKIYIGQSIDIITRLQKYQSLNCKHQVKLYNSIQKYGWVTHKFEILCQCTREELNNLEIYYIKLYQTFNTKHGLNLMSGGNTRVWSKESKDKLSQTCKRLKRKPPLMAGKKSNSEGNRRVMTNDEKKSRMLTNIQSIKVVDTKTKVVYNSCREAARENNISSSFLSAVLRGEYKNNTNLIYHKDDNN